MVVRDILNSWMEQRKAVLISNYQNKGLKASGKFERNINITTTDMQSSMTAPQYTGALVFGRKPTAKGGSGGPSLYKMILEWIDDKGITPRDNMPKATMAWIIARNIHKNGIKVPNAHNDGRLLTDTFTQESKQELFKSITRSYITELKTDIHNLWQ